jgi:hypothetical protein
LPNGSGIAAPEKKKGNQNKSGLGEKSQVLIVANFHFSKFSTFATFSMSISLPSLRFLPDQRSHSKILSSRSIPSRRLLYYETAHSFFFRKKEDSSPKTERKEKAIKFIPLSTISLPYP